MTPSAGKTVITGICLNSSIENYFKMLKKGIVDYFSLFNLPALSVRHMDYFYNVNIHDMLYFLNKKEKQSTQLFLKGSPRHFADAPTTLGWAGGGLTRGRYVPGIQNVEPALLELIQLGAEERRKEKNP